MQCTVGILSSMEFVKTHDWNQSRPYSRHHETGATAHSKGAFTRYQVSCERNIYANHWSLVFLMNNGHGIDNGQIWNFLNVFCQYLLYLNFNHRVYGKDCTSWSSHSGTLYVVFTVLKCNLFLCFTLLKTVNTTYTCVEDSATGCWNIIY
jgi:hypothetical protein